MKHQYKFVFIAFCTLLVLSLIGCGPLMPNSTEPQQTTAATTTATTVATVAEQTDGTIPESNVSTTAPTTTPDTPADDGSYLVRIPWNGISIFSEPIYDAAIVQVIEPGTYTIVEETTDFEGNLWGKLKSGLGWLDLTQINAYHENTPPVIANYASEALLASGNYHHFVTDTYPFIYKIVFYPTEKLSNVTLYSMILTETMERDETLFTIDQLSPDCPFVAEIPFPGDMSTYEICFTDASGNLCTYRLGLSGRNGTIMFFPVNN